MTTPKQMIRCYVLLMNPLSSVWPDFHIFDTEQVGMHRRDMLFTRPLGLCSKLDTCRNGVLFFHVQKHEP